MDKDTLQKNLVHARQHVAAGERLIAYQRIAIEGLNRWGYDATQAERSLEALQANQLELVARRDELIRQIADYLNKRER